MAEQETEQVEQSDHEKAEEAAKIDEQADETIKQLEENPPLKARGLARRRGQVQDARRHRGRQELRRGTDQEPRPARSRAPHGRLDLDRRREGRQPRRLQGRADPRRTDGSQRAEARRRGQGRRRLRGVASPRGLPPDHARRPGLCLLPRRRRERRRGRRGRSALRDRRVPRARALPRREHRARARDAHPRRPRLRPRPARIGDGRDDPRPRGGARRVRPRRDRGRLDPRARLRSDRSGPHARPPARAHGVPAHRHRSRRGAVGDPLRRQPVRRRHRAPRPRDREGGGRARHLPQPARQAARPRPGGRGVARPPRRLAVRGAGDGHEGVDHDRVRAPLQRAAQLRVRGRLRRALARAPRAAAAELPGDRRAQPRPAAHRGRRSPPAHAPPGRAAPPGRRDARRRPHRRAVR